GRAVAGDVDETVLPRHERLQVAPRPFRQRVVVGAVDEDHVHAHPWDANTADRLAARRFQPIAPCLLRDAPLLRSDRRSGHGGGGDRLAPLVVLRCELVLAPGRVERGEGVLPLPDDGRPDERQHAEDDQHRAQEADPAAHQFSNASGNSWAAPRLRRSCTAREGRRLMRRPGPRGGRPAASGYGPYRRTERAAIWAAPASQMTSSGTTTNGT